MTGHRDARGGDGGDADATPRICSSDIDCDDGVFCNGPEACEPGALEASAVGCVASAAPCMAGQTCDEEADACRACSTDSDGDGSVAPECGGDDCDDADPGRFPGNTEVCDADDRDEDCDPMTFGVRDLDGDGYVSGQCCNDDGAGSTRCGDDCNDMRNVSRPGNTEACDGFDNDCDGDVDEEVRLTFYVDADGDGHGSSAMTMMGCEAPAGYVATSGDCDDTEMGVHPGVAELCDRIDANCSSGGGLDATEDADEDGHAPEGHEYLGGLPSDDCDDADADVVRLLWYPDSDGDGHGRSSAEPTDECARPGDAWVLSNDDCNDNRPDVNPTADFQTSAVCVGSARCCDGSMLCLPAPTIIRDFNCSGELEAPTPGDCTPGSSTRIGCVSGYVYTTASESTCFRNTDYVTCTCTSFLGRCVACEETARETRVLPCR